MENSTTENIKALTEPQTSQPKPDHPVLDASERKAHIEIILHILFSRILKKLKITACQTCTCGSSEHTQLLRWILEEVWDQLQDEKLILTPENLKDIDKHVLRDLRDAYGCVKTVLVALELKRYIAVKVIATSLTEHLSKQKKSPPARFFSALATAV